MAKELKRYQENAVDELVLKSKLLLAKDINPRTIVFQSPTGSGKTFMMSQYVGQLIDEMKGDDLCFLWLSPGKGSLHEQSYKSLKKEFAGFPAVYLLEEEFVGSRRTIDKNEVVVGNWEKLSSKDGKTSEWKSKLMKDKETVNFRELVENTRNSKTKIILIIDESHSRDKAERAFELRNEIIKPDLTIEMSATPTSKEYDEKVFVPPIEVIDEGMIKKEIIVNQDIDKISDDTVTSQGLIMQAAYNKRLEIQEEYKKNGVDINPLVLIQIPNTEAGRDKQDFVESFLGEKGVNKDNHKLAVWTTEEKVNQEKELITKNNDTAEFLIFKQAVDTGWDCPRAHILVGFREIQSIVFKIQVVGRIIRMPEAKHYDTSVLDTAYIFTNVKEDKLGFEGDEDWITKNIIKSIHVRRSEKYKPLKLMSYYRNRIDYGDITAQFNGVLDEVFCDYFGIKKGDFSATAITKSLKKLKDKIDIENLVGKDEIILNKRIDAKLFDHLSDETIKSDENFQASLSEDDKERAFENVIKLNLNGYAPKRSLPIVKQALYRWFKKYIGTNLLNGGIIYVQNIVLNNFEVFGRLFDEAVRAYEPVKKEEIQEKIKDTEEWNTAWEVSETRNYNPNIYKPYNFNLSLYKHSGDKKAYLQIDSEIEKDFLEFLEKNKGKVAWWWQNGNEHMALNFGVKYGEGSTFQPDFLVLFTDGRLGIFDTKASGDREDVNKLKAEALQKYIKEENKRKRKEIVFGGIVIQQGNHLMVNSDATYKPFTYSETVRDGGKTYGENKQRTGWQYLDF